MYLTFVNAHPECRPHELPALQPSRSWVDGEKAILRVIHDLEDMRMAADENIRSVQAYYRLNISLIMPRIASDMGHQYLLPFAVKKLCLGTFVAYFLRVTVSVHPDEGLERGDFMDEVQPSAEVSCVPDFIDGFKELPELV